MKTIFSFLGIGCIALVSYYFINSDNIPNGDTPPKQENTEIATFAGGCFWCIEPAFEETEGVISAVVGYAGGEQKNANYTAVSEGKTEHREAVQIEYDPERVSYEELLHTFLEQINPTDSDGQFADRGFQYSPAVYYHSLHQKEETKEVFDFVESQKIFSSPFAVSREEYSNFFPAEKYHQNYYKKNATHYNAYKVGSGRAAFIKDAWRNSNELWDLKAKQDEKLKQKKTETLSDLEKKVLLHEGTEQPFTNEYWDNKKAGVYVDKLSGEVLFLSSDIFDSGTGWPSFTSPAHKENIVEVLDFSLAGTRTEVRARESDTHLGHVFTDGPKNRGGLRYCINSAAVDFVPKQEMKERGYGEYLNLLE